MTRKLLVADDSVTIQKVVQLTFAGEDVAIEAVSSGDQAVERAYALRPDIILADVFMPGLNGYEVCSKVKGDAELAGTPVVLLVGTFEPFDDAEAARVRADGHLTKPFDTSELIQLVRSLIERAAPACAAAASPAPTEPPGTPTPALARAAGAGERPLVSARARDSFLGDGRILDVFAPQMLAAALQPVPVQPAAARQAPEEPPPAVEPAPTGVGQPALAPPEQPEPVAEVKPRLAAAPQVIPFPGTRLPDEAAEGVELPEEIVNLIVDRVVRRMSPDVIREVAWEVIPELAEIMIRQMLNEKGLPPTVQS